MRGGSEPAANMVSGISSDEGRLADSDVEAAAFNRFDAASANLKTVRRAGRFRSPLNYRAFGG